MSFYRSQPATSIRFAHYYVQKNFDTTNYEFQELNLKTKIRVLDLAILYFLKPDVPISDNVINLYLEYYKTYKFKNFLKIFKNKKILIEKVLTPSMMYKFLVLFRKERMTFDREEYEKNPKLIDYFIAYSLDLLGLEFVVKKPYIYEVKLDDDDDDEEDTEEKK